MAYVIGIDGGGTKTKLFVADLEGKIISEAVAGPGNILSSGYDVVKTSLKQVFKEAIDDKGFTLEDCKVCCVGMAGAARESISKQIEEIVRSLGYMGKLIITHDAEVALLAGTEGGEGILMVAGTGAIGYGQDEHGTSHRVSGWGHMIGDEGSAYSIGKAILNKVMCAYDGRGEETYLTQLVLNKMQVTSPDEIIGCIYQPHITKEHIASYAVLIEEACEQDDRVALSIIQETTEAIIQNIDALIKHLKFEDKVVTLVLNGSVLLKNNLVFSQVMQYVSSKYTKIIAKKLTQEAAYGAVVKALKAI